MRNCDELSECSLCRLSHRRYHHNCHCHCHLRCHCCCCFIISLPPRLWELCWSSLQWFILCCWCGCHMKTRYSNMEYTDNSMYTNTEVEFFSLTYPIDFWRPLSAFTQCLCNVLIVSFFVFTCVVPSFSTFVAAFSAIRWTRYSNMEYTDNVMYTNTEIAIVSLTYPIDF